MKIEYVVENILGNVVAVKSIESGLMPVALDDQAPQTVLFPRISTGDLAPDKGRLVALPPLQTRIPSPVAPVTSIDLAPPEPVEAVPSTPAQPKA